LKTLIRPCARGPGASAMGGAGVGDGEREEGSVAAGMMKYECYEMRDSARPVAAQDVPVLDKACANAFISLFTRRTR
jgi:hypothetical protein